MAERQTFAPVEPSHPRLRRWLPSYVHVGAENIVFDLGGAPGKVAKVGVESLANGYVKKGDHWISQLDPGNAAPLSLETIQDELAGKKARFDRLKEVFGEHALDQTYHFWKVPYDPEWSQAALPPFIFDEKLKPLSKGSHPREYWAFVTVQQEAEEMLNGSYYFSLHNPLIDDDVRILLDKGIPEGDAYKHALRQTRGPLLISPKPTWQFIDGDLFGLLCPKTLSLWRAAMRDPALHGVVKDFVERSIDYTNETREVLDFQGAQNVIFYETASGSYSYSIVDPFFPQHIDHGKPFTIDQPLRYIDGSESDKTGIGHVFLYTRILNGLANALDMEKRIVLFPEEKRQKARRVFTADWVERPLPHARKDSALPPTAIRISYDPKYNVPLKHIPTETKKSTGDTETSQLLVSIEAIRKQEQERRELAILEAHCSAATRPGDSHYGNNEDFHAFSDSNRFAIIADGMSTDPEKVVITEDTITDGYVSSRRAVEDILAELIRMRELKDPQETANQLSQAFNRIAERYREIGQPLRTTLTVAQVITDNRNANIAVIASVGDTRVYLYNKDGLTLLTEDHGSVRGFHPDSRERSDMTNMLDKIRSLADFKKVGFVYRDNAQYLFSTRNELSHDMARVQIRPHIAITEVNPDDILILTTDGIHDNLTFSDIEAAVKSGENITEKLVANAYVVSQQERNADNIRPKPDDMTVVVMRLSKKIPESNKEELVGAK